MNFNSGEVKETGGITIEFHDYNVIYEGKVQLQCFVTEFNLTEHKNFL